MEPLISPALLLAATLVSFCIALVFARLGLAAMFRILPSSRRRLRVINGGRARTAS